MKNSFLKSWATATCAVTMLVSMSSCTKDLAADALDGDQSSKLAGKGVLATTLPPVITSNLSVSGDIVVDGKVYVKSPAVLTIAAGSIVRGVFKANPADASALVILKGAKIQAIGTAASPIIMTGLVDASNPSLNAGDWGGLVILGNVLIQ